jgi:hypothetical protein
VNHAKNAWFFLPDEKKTCKSALTFLAGEANKTMRKVHGFFRRTKKPMQQCLDFSTQRGQNHAKSASFFLPDEKNMQK